MSASTRDQTLTTDIVAIYILNLCICCVSTDYPRVIRHYIQQDDFEAALEVLKKEVNYDYCFPNIFLFILLFFLVLIVFFEKVFFGEVYLNLLNLPSIHQDYFLF